MSAHPGTRWFTAGLLLLTASTGVIDAVSYLALDKVFTGNMTGNVLFVGFALLGVANIPLLNNLLALAGFVIGAIIGGRIVGRGHPVGFPRRSLVTVAVGGALMLALGATWLAIGRIEGWVLLVITAVLAAVMGAQVAAVKPIGNADVTTVVVTSTLANVARESRLAGGAGPNQTARLLAVLAMGAGAAIGAAIIHFLGDSQTIGGPAGALALVAGLGVYLLGLAAILFGERRGRRERRESAIATTTTTEASLPATA